MMAQQEQRFREMLEAQKEEIKDDVRRMMEEQPSVQETGNGDDGFSFGGGPDGGGSRHDEEEEYEEGLKVRCSVKDFNGCHPPTYDGTPDPIVLHNWINEMEMAFSDCQCLDTQRTNLAVTKLRDDALDWWLDLKGTHAPHAMDRLGWEEFLERLKDRFCTPEEIRQLEKEFLGIKKGSMTLAEYNSRFLKLMSFSRRLVPDESAKVSQYVDGLPYHIQMSMGEPETLQRAMRVALRLVRTSEAQEKARSGGHTFKRKLEGNSREEVEMDKKKQKTLTRSKSWDGRARVTDSGLCFNCGESGHFSNKCAKGTKCFECNEFGHISLNCPNKEVGGEKKAKEDAQKAKGRAFQMVAKEAQDGKDVAAGKPLVNSHFVNLIFGR